MWSFLARRLLLVCVLVTLLASLSSADGWKPRSSARIGKGRGGPSADGGGVQRHRFFLPNPCVLNDERTGAQFDLTSLRKTGSDYTASDGDYFYRMNVCGPVSKGGPCGNALVCQYSNKADEKFVAKIALYDGYFGPRLTLIDANDPGLGVTASYLNGDICFLGPTKRRTPRTTIIQYRCAHETQDQFEVHEDKDTCTFRITLHTSAACWPPGNIAGTISSGTSFLILFFLFTSLYVGIFVLYNRSQGKEGRDQLPHVEWWTVTLPALVSEGVAFSWAKFQDFKEQKLKNGSGGLLGSNDIDPDDPYKGKGAPTARSDDL